MFEAVAVTCEPLPSSTLDVLADVFSAISAAIEHGYGIGPAAAAAGEVLAGLSHSEAVAAAATLAALMATDLKPRDPESIEVWRGRYSYLLACRERPE